MRPPLAQERLELLPDGRVGLTLARPWADGTRALVFGGVEFLEKLAVLIPKPRINLLIYHGILGARARQRPAAVASAAPPAHCVLAPDAIRATTTAAKPPVRRAWLWADLMRRVFRDRRSRLRLRRTPAVRRDDRGSAGRAADPPASRPPRPMRQPSRPPARRLTQTQRLAFDFPS